MQLQGGEIAQEILGELYPQTGILYNTDGTQVQLPPGTELKTVMTPNGQVSKDLVAISIDHELNHGI